MHHHKCAAATASVARALTTVFHNERAEAYEATTALRRERMRCSPSHIGRTIVSPPQLEAFGCA